MYPEFQWRRLAGCIAAWAVAVFVLVAGAGIPVVMSQTKSAPLKKVSHAITPQVGASYAAGQPAAGASFSNQRVTTQAPPASGCGAVPPSVNVFFPTDSTVYLFFDATVTTSDTLTSDWLPPGTVTAFTGSYWIPSSGNYCFPGASWNISNTPANQFGQWYARVYDNGNLQFSVPFSVTAPVTQPSGTVNANWQYGPGSFGTILYFIAAVPPYTNCQVVRGSLPPGFSFALSQGSVNGVASTYCLLSGTPTTAGTYTFAVTTTDSKGTTGSPYGMAITINPPIAITTTQVPAGVVGTSYNSFQLQATGGTLPFQWSIKTGSLPAGLSLNSGTGTISGTPTAAGVYSFTVQETDAQGATGTQQLSLTVTGPTCSYSLSPSSASVGAGASTGNTFTVNTVSGCGWAASTSPTSFLHITNGFSGTGSGGVVTFSVDANPGTTARSDVISVTGTNGFTVTQAGASCSYSLSPSSASVVAAASTGNTFTVNTSSGCSWTASTSSTSTFLHITAGGSGTTSGPVTYSVDANWSTSPRTGTISVTSTNGFTVTQAGEGPVSNSLISTSAPSANCATPGAQKYYPQNGTMYPWISFSGGSSSDVVAGQIVHTSNGSVVSNVTLSRPAGGNCNYATVSLTNLGPDNYSVIFSLNGVGNQVATQPFTIAPNQVTLSTVGTRALLPGSNQVNLQAAIPNSLPDAAAVTVSPSFTTIGVANTIAGSAYDCRFTQSPVSVSISAGALQSNQVTVSAGTVAGNCVFGPTVLSVPSQNFQLTPTPSPVSLNNVGAPYIAQVSESATGNPFTLVVTGYSMTRDLQSITYTFSTSQSNYTVASGPVTVTVATPAATWFNSAGSAATGGQFQYTQQFNISGGTSANLSSVSVTVTSQTSGTSPPVTYKPSVRRAGASTTATDWPVGGPVWNSRHSQSDLAESRVAPLHEGASQANRGTRRTA